MSSRVRNSEFRRDVKEETLPRTDGREINYWPGKDHHSKFRGGNPSKWSEVEPNNASKPADCSRWSTRESSPGDSNVKMDETIKDIRHILPIDTAFHGRGRLHNSRPFDDSLSQALSDRVRGNIRNRSRDRDGSRSRSRNRNQNQNQSRSRSRSRSRGRVKAKGMGRSRSRSRSRSWDRGGGGSQGRSRSPYFDERHHPIESADRPSGPRLSSRVCRDFAMGHCRRGNQCRFLHQEGVNSEGGKRSDDIAEQSSIRPEYGGSSRYSDNRTSADHTRDKVSDRSRRYNGEEEPVWDSIICCKEFLKGRCRWGASCRYPHHVTSGDNYNKSHRNDSYNHDSKVPPDISGKVPCMYFPSGKCHREDCKFSHDALTSGGYDARSRDDRLNQKLDEKSKPWTGPTWDEATPGLSNNVHHSAQPDNSFQNLISRDSAANENSADDMSRSWKGPTWGDASASNLSHIAKPSGQPDSSVQKLNSHDSAANEECHDDKNKSWNGPTWDEVAAPDLSDIVKSSGRGNISPRNLNLCDSVSTGNCSDMKKSWNGPTWDGSSAPVLSDLNKSVEWGDRSVGNLQSHDPVTIEQQSGARGDHGREKRRDGPPWNDKIAERNEYFSSHQQGATNDRYMGANEFKGTKNFVGDEDTQLVSDGSRSQTLGGVCMPTNEKNIMIDASGRELASLVLQSQASEVSRIQQLHRHEQDNHTTFDDSNVLDVEMVSEETTYSALTPRQVFTQGGHGLHPPSNLGGFDQNRHTLSLNPSNGPNVDLSGSAQDLFHLLNQQNQTRIYQNEASETQKVLDIGVPQVMPELSETVVSSNQVAQITDLPAILTQISQNGQLPQLFAALNPNGAKGLVQSLPTSASVMPPVNPMVVLPNLDTKSEEQYDQARESMETRKLDSNYEPPGFLSSSIGKENEVPHERLSLLSASVPSSTNLHASSASGEEHHKSPKSKQHESDAKGAVNDKNVAEKRKLEHGNIQAGNADARGNVEESTISNDEKAMRLFKIALVEFVKEILKPTWKEGRMSREVHKTIVKKVVDKVTSTLQGNQIPKTQEKIEHYMAFSKSKITKLVEAYVERSLKPVDA